MTRSISDVARSAGIGAGAGGPGVIGPAAGPSRRETALVTGASSGLGVAFARQLAQRGFDLVLVARRVDRLTALAAELSREHGVEAIALGCDLGSPVAIEGLLAELRDRGLEIDVLVNNAGAAAHRPLLASSWQTLEGQLQLNIGAVVQLTRALAERMSERRKGHILNVASIGAFLPVPGFATYAAAKAFVRSFSEAVAEELSRSGVRVCCLSPGGVDTEFFQVAGQEVDPWMRLALMSPARCARIGLRALFGCRRSIVSGYSNALAMFATRFLPRWLLAMVAGLLMSRPRPLDAT
ncbi:MAG: SDR family oxidoreductase [Polyangiaceae bacterium]